MTTKEPNQILPLFQGLLPLSREQVVPDILAGVTLAALALPEVLGYTKIAGTPVITGIYTMLLPMLLYGIFGGSRHLVVGADSATAAIVAASLSGLSLVPGSAEWLARAQVLALLAGGVLLLARVLRLGFLADFLSHTVLTGFLTGVGIQVAVGQLADILGLPARRHDRETPEPRRARGRSQPADTGCRGGDAHCDLGGASAVEENTGRAHWRGGRYFCGLGLPSRQIGREAAGLGAKRPPQLRPAARPLELDTDPATPALGRRHVRCDPGPERRDLAGFRRDRK